MTKQENLKEGSSWERQPSDTVTPTKREFTIGLIMDVLHEFHKDNLEYPYENLPLSRQRRKKDYANKIMDIVLENYE